MSKVLLITGASRGIGAETARLAAEHGYSLCLNYLHSEAAASELLASLHANGHHAIAYQANVGVEAEVEAMYQAIDREFGRLDGLVNNAGILEPQSDLVDMTVARWQRILEIYRQFSMCPRSGQTNVDQAGWRGWLDCQPVFTRCRPRRAA